VGWVLNTELTPTDAPVHDTRSEEERLHPKEKPLWQRVLMVTGAVLLILGIIAIKILAHLH
jgi:hypothetical protein